MIGRVIDGMVMWDWVLVFCGVVSLIVVIALVLLAIVLGSGKPR
jgi:hypothetical protein